MYIVQGKHVTGKGKKKYEKGKGKGKGKIFRYRAGKTNAIKSLERVQERKLHEV